MITLAESFNETDVFICMPAGFTSHRLKQESIHRTPFQKVLKLRQQGLRQKVNLKPPRLQVRINIFFRSASPFLHSPCDGSCTNLQTPAETDAYRGNKHKGTVHIITYIHLLHNRHVRLKHLGTVSLFEIVEFAMIHAQHACCRLAPNSCK